MAAMTPLSRQRLARTGRFAAAALALAGVFSLYTHPEFAVMLVDQIWSCF